MINTISPENQNEITFASALADSVTYKFVPLYGGAEMVISNLESVDLTTLKMANHKFVIEATYGETTWDLYTSYIDIYDSTEQVVWNTVSLDNISYVKSHFKNYDGNNNTSELNGITSITQIEGVDYFKSAFTSFPEYYYEAYSTIYPLHSKAYYEAYVGQEIKLSFDVYFGMPVQTEGAYTSIGFDFHYFGLTGAWRVGERDQKTSATTGMSNKYTVTLSLDDFVTNWDAYHGGKPTHNHHSTGVVPYDYLVAWCGMPQGKVWGEIDTYISSIRVSVGSAEAKTDSTVYTQNVLGVTSINALDYIKNADCLAHIESFAPYGLTYKVTGPSGAEVGLDIATVTADSIGNYTIQVYTGSVLLYTGYFKTELTAIDGGDKLFDVAGINTLELKSVLNQDGINTVEAYEGFAISYKFTDTRGNELVIDNGSLAITESVLRYYESLVVYVNDILIYTGAIDLYDSLGNFVWNYISEDTIDYYVGKTKSTCASNPTITDGVETTVATVGGVNYAKSQFTNVQGKTNTVTILPIHSLGYYEQYQGLGIKLSFSFMFGHSVWPDGWVTDSAETGYKTVKADYHYFGMGNGSYRPNGSGLAVNYSDTGVHVSPVLTAKFDLDTFITNWAEYTSCYPDTTCHSTSTPSYDYLVARCYYGGWNKTFPNTIYVTALTPSVGTVNAITDSTVYEKDVLGVEEVDILEFITDDNLAAINEYKNFDLSYKVTLPAGGEIVLTDSTLIPTVAAARLGKYTIKAYTGTSLLYTGYFNLTISSYTDTSARLIDVKGMASYDMLGADLISQEIYDGVVKYENATLTFVLIDVAGNVTEISGTSIANAVETLRYYKTVQLFVNDMVVYTGEFDLYDSSSAFVWNTISESNLGYYDGQAKGDCGDVSSTAIGTNSIVNVDGVEYVKVETTKITAGVIAVTVLPLHSLEYYEQYQGLNVQLSFKFAFGLEEWPSTVDTATKVSTDYHYFGMGNGKYRPGGSLSIAYSETTPLISSSKVDVTLNLDDFITHWDEYTDSFADTHCHNQAAVDPAWGYLVARCHYGTFAGKWASTIYVSALTASIGETFEKVVDETNNLVNVTDVSSINVLDYVSSEEVKTLVNDYANFGATYTLTDSNGNVIDLGVSGEFDIENSDLVRAYTINALIEGEVVYTGYIDLYTDNEELVWNTTTVNGGLTGYYDDHTIRKVPQQTINFEGKDAILIDNFTGHLFITLNPIHSKAFYERFVGAGYSVNYSVYVSNADGGTYNQMSVYKKNVTLDSGSGVLNTWRNRSISLDEIVENWDYIVGGKCYDVDDPSTAMGACWDSRAWTCMFYIYNANKMDIYFAGATIGQSLESIKVTETIDKDVKDVATLDLASLISDEGDRVIAIAEEVGETLTYTYTAPDGSAIESSIDARKYDKLGAYKLVITAGDVEIYNLTVNVSNSDYVLSENDQDYSVDFATSDSFDGATMIDSATANRIAKIAEYDTVSYVLVDEEGVETVLDSLTITFSGYDLVGSYTLRAVASDVALFEGSIEIEHTGYVTSVDSYVYLVDFKDSADKTRYKLTSNMSADAIARIKRIASQDASIIGKLVDAMGNVTEIAITPDGLSNLYFELDSADDFRLYSFTISASDVDLVTKNFDLYDSSTGYVFHNMSAQNANLIEGARNNVVYEATYADEYYSVAFPARNSYDSVITIYPLHGKSYYENLRGLGYSFSYYLYQVSDPTGVEGNVSTGISDLSFGLTNRANLGTGIEKAKKLTIDLDTLLDNWDAYVSKMDRSSTYGYTVRDLAAYYNSGEYKNICPVTLYVGRFEFGFEYSVDAIENTTLYSVNVEGKTTLDLSAYITNETAQKNIATFSKVGVKYVLTDVNGTVFDNGKSSKITINDEMLRIWTFQVMYEDVLLYTGHVDLYDLSKPVVWNDVVSATSMIKFDAANTVSTNEVGQVYTVNREGVDVTVVAYTKSGGNGSWFAMRPIHDKSYYEKFVGMGLYLNYSIYGDASNATNPANKILNQGYAYGNGDYLADLVGSKWLDNSLSIDTIISKWDAIMNANWDGVWGNRNKFGMAMVYALTNGGKFALSGFTVSANLASAMTGGEILVDIDGKDEINLFDVLTAKQQAIVNQYGLDCEVTATLTAKDSTVVTATDMIVAVSDIEKGVYTLSIKADSTEIYNATLDVYSNAEGAVWNYDLSADIISAQTYTYSTGWANSGRVALDNGAGYTLIDASTIVDDTHPLYGKTGIYFEFVASQKQNLGFSILPLHTKTYYKELLGAKDNILSFEMYFVGSFSGIGCGGGGYYGLDNKSRAFSTWRATSPGTNKWVKYSLSFDNYLIGSSSTDSFNALYLDFNKIGQANDRKQVMFSIEASAADSKVYIKAPYVETMPEYIASYSTAKTVDVNTSSVYDLTNLFTELELAKFDYYVGKYGADKIFYKLTFSDSSYIYIWANNSGAVELNLMDKTTASDGTESGTVLEKLALGPVAISGKLCDIVNFPGHNKVGIFGIGTSCNNNQIIATYSSVTFTNLPATTEVYEIAVADSTAKYLRADNFNDETSTYTSVTDTTKEGGLTALYSDSSLVDDVALKFSAFKNETESAQLQIVSKSDVGQYRVILSDLTSGENVLLSANFSLYHQLYTKLSHIAGATNPTGVGEYPDAILPMDVALDAEVTGLKAGINQGVWISVYVPGDQPAGVYTGTFDLVIGASVYEIPVSVTVYDYTLSDEVQMKTSLSANYSDIVNLETPYEYDEEGNLIVNSSGNKTGTLSDELVDAYSEFFSDHKISISPIVQSTYFSGAWQGYPYDPNALFDTSVITVVAREGDVATGKLVSQQRYAYEFPLRNKDADGNTIIYSAGVEKNGHFTYGYPLYLSRVDEYFEGMVERSKDPNTVSFRLPVSQASTSNFNYANINTIFAKWRGSLFEFRDDIPDGERYNVINQLVLRDTIEIFFKKAMELHKAGDSVDVFAKADVFPSWIDEFALVESKIKNAQHLLKYMKDFFPNCAEWLATVYADEINDDPFLLSMLNSLSNVRILVTADTVRDLDPSIHYANFVSTPSSYGSEAGREGVTDWVNTVYDGEGERWIYIGGNTYPSPSNNIESPLLNTRMMSWIMSEYDIKGFLYWATMRSKYEDKINASAIESIVGKIVKDGDIIELDDFYNNAIHYSSVGGDGFLVYPGAYYNVLGPIGTIRLEAITDGIEDYNLFYDLKAMYEEENLKDSFYTVMRRLSEMLYTGVRCKTQDGYTADFSTSREALANMLILARDNKVFADSVYYDDATSKWLFTVVSPSAIAEDVKTAVGSTFVSQETVTMGSGEGVKMVFEVSSDAIDNGYVTFTYAGKTVSLSIETLVETAEVEALAWGSVTESSTYSYHNSYYTNGASGTSATVTVKTLSVEESVGDRTEGKYFFVEPASVNSTWNLGFTFQPTDIDYETVKAYVGKAVLKFDVYMVTTSIEDGSVYKTEKVWYSLGKNTNSSHRSNEWFSVSIDFKQIEANWDTMMDTSTKTYNDNWSTSWRALFAVNGDSHGAEGVHTTSYYIGNFRIVHI